MSRSSATQRRARPIAAAALAALLIAALAALVWLDNSANRGVTFAPAPRPIPHAGGPALGVNLFNIHLEPDPAAVRRSFELARDLGARYARMQVPWDDIEIHARGDFEDRRNLATVGAVSSWDKYDRIVAEANRADVSLIMRLERPPNWARERFRATPEFQAGLLLDGNSTGPPDDMADYASFVRAVVERYDGDGLGDAPAGQRVRHFQIWNEPNLKGEWNWQTPKPEDFVALLRVGATAARAANPDALILFPGLAPTDGLDARAPMTELEYLDRVYAAGGADYFDIMAAQSYGLGQPPTENRYVFLRGRGNWSWSHPVDTRNDVSRVVLLREVMERNGDAQTPIWVTEFGWNSAPDTIPPERRVTWGQPVSEQTKGDYLVGQIERARAQWPWMGVMNVWMLRYGGYAEPNPDDPTPYFALVSRDWQILPAYERLRDYTAQPAVAGVGAFGWDHPAVEPIPGGWRLRFSGTRLSLIGGLAGAITPSIDGQPVALARDGLDGRQLLSTAQLPDAVHTLEILGGPAPEWFIVERARPLGWLWDYGPLLLLLGLAASGAAAMGGLLQGLDRLRGLWRTRISARARAALVMALMGLCLAVAYRASPQLPLTLAGLLAFAGLALYRPNLALLWVILTAPLYFMPKGIFDERFGIRPEGIYLPLHELVLVIVCGAAGARWASSLLSARTGGGWRATLGGLSDLLGLRRPPRLSAAIGYRQLAIGVFLAAGLWGLLIAEDRGPALREFRWLILEPLVFFGLVIYHLRQDPHDPARSLSANALISAFLISGSAVGLIGILQFLGLNLVPVIGTKVGFSDDSIFVEGVRRVNSVYGHPNNLGLFLGRVWPVAAALLLGRLLAGRPAADDRRPTDARHGAAAGASERPHRPGADHRASPPPATHHRPAGAAASGDPSANRLVLAGLLLTTLLPLGGLLVSFSRGAYLGAVAAALVLGLLLAPRGFWRSRRVLLPLGALAGLAALALVAVVALDIQRLNPFGASSGVRIQTWASALAMLRDHPLGIGLDQFGRLYPRYIAPELANTNEINTAHPHNLLLDLALRLGPLGLIACAWLIWRFYRAILRGGTGRRGQGGSDRWRHLPLSPSERSERVPVSASGASGLVLAAASGLVLPAAIGLAAAMAAALVHGMVDSFYFWPDLAFAFWLMLALAWRDRPDHV